MTNKVVLWVGGVVAVLLVVTIIVGVVLINTVRAEADSARFRECMAAQGYSSGVQQPEGATDDELDAWLAAGVDAAEFCRR